MQLEKKNILTDEVLTIFRILLTEGDEIRLVGGCVRDFMLGLKSNDVDFACKYPPQKTLELLGAKGIKTIATGLEHGTVTAIINDKTMEITTLRQDVECDGRHAKVKFCDSYKEDAKRRDFTINALYMDKDGKLYDYFNGLADLNRGIVRFIGDPRKRIEEDNLRILRFFRFHGRFGDEIDYNSMQSCFDARELLANLSGEVITKEMEKILALANYDQVITLMEHAKVFSVLLNADKVNLSGLQLANALSSDLSLTSKLFILGSYGGKLLECRKKMYASWQLTKDVKTFLTTVVEQKYNLEHKEDIVAMLERHNKQFTKEYALCSYIEHKTQYELEQILEQIEAAVIPIFPVSAKDLMDAKLAVAGPKISTLLGICKTLWIQSNFTLSKDKLLTKLKANLQANVSSEAKQ